MAATVTLIKSGKTINRKTKVYNVALDNSYPTGGYSLPLSQLGFNAVDIILISGGNGYHLQWDYTNNKLMAYTTAGTQTTNATDLSALTAVRIKVIGQ